MTKSKWFPNTHKPIIAHIATNNLYDEVFYESEEIEAEIGDVSWTGVYVSDGESSWFEYCGGENVMEWMYIEQWRYVNEQRSD